MSFLTSAENEIAFPSRKVINPPPSLQSNAPPRQSSRDNPSIFSNNILQPHKLLALYHSMVMARAIERRMWVMNRTADWQASLTMGGSEAVQGAAAAALRPGTDWVLPCDRDLALCLAMGISPLDVMLAVFGRAADPSSGGRQAPPGFASRRARIVSTSAVVGAQVVHAAGIAYASRMQALDEVTMVSIGERGTDTGDWHEGLNFAAVHRLPLICLVQDSAPRGSALRGPGGADLIVKRARGYGMAGDTVDGSDFSGAFDTINRAVERARAGEGPTLIHARTPNLASRTARGSYLPREELEAMARQDPIELMRQGLHDSSLLDDTTEAQVQRDCISVVEAAIAQARESAAPEPARALDNVFGNR
jgi:2-oxoisovalerate dehydrogenase E1 component alpha subunit